MQSSPSDTPHFSCFTNRAFIPFVHTITLCNILDRHIHAFVQSSHTHPSSGSSTPSPLHTHSSDVEHSILDVIVDLDVRSSAWVWLGLAAALTCSVGDVKRGVEEV